MPGSRTIRGRSSPDWGQRDRAQIVLAIYELGLVALITSLKMVSGRVLKGASQVAVWFTCFGPVT